DQKEVKDWTITGPRLIKQQSVMNQNKFEAPFEGLLEKSERRLPGARRELLGNPQDGTGTANG
ncbi:MAG: hypothetical protein M3Q97_08235, partial [Bacteroidota bacterium]|nr:hypothetical protein [Bacteroidota bacterium]